jgi:hypothetical protein
MEEELAAAELASTVAGSESRPSSGWLFFGVDIPLPLRKSSCIASARYNILARKLTVEFVAGGDAQHSCGVLKILRWIKSGSVGEFYNAEIRLH